MRCDGMRLFWPRLGGVEMHVWSLSQCLMKLGWRVVVITHDAPGADGKRRVGVRTMTNGLKVYYAPLPVFHDGNSFPAVYPFAAFRDILVREQVDIARPSGDVQHDARVHPSRAHHGLQDRLHRPFFIRFFRRSEREFEQSAAVYASWRRSRNCGVSDVQRNLAPSSRHASGWLRFRMLSIQSSLRREKRAEPSSTAE